MQLGTLNQRLNAWRLVAASAWIGWISELSKAIPSWLRDQFVAPRGRITVFYAPDHVRVSRTVRDRTTELAALEHKAETPAFVTQAERDAISAAVSSDDIVRAQLPQELILFRRLTLPLARGRDLKQLLALEIDHQSPVEGSAVVFGFSVNARDRHHRQMDVALWIVEQDTVKALAAASHALGLHPRAITVEGPGGARSEIPLQQPAHLKTPRAFLKRILSCGRRSGIAVLACSVLLLGASTLAFSYLHNRQLVHDLKSQVAEARKEALIAGHLRTKLDKVHAALLFLPTRRRSSSVLSRLNALSALLPNGTWLTSFEMKDNRIRLRGMSTNAASLIQIIDRSAKFTNASFEAPLTKVRSHDLERFELRLDAKEPKS